MGKNGIEKLAKRLLGQSLTNNRVDPLKVAEISKAIKGLKDVNILSLFKDYSKMIRVKIEHETAYVETPFATDGEWASEIEKSIHAKFPEVVYVKFITNPTLIAGIKIQIADMVYENSLKARINSLRKEN